MRSQKKKTVALASFSIAKSRLWKRSEEHKYVGDFSAPNTKLRSALLDNARLVAASLILVMHFLEYLRPHSTFLDYFYYASWGFRLPVYILIAGYFSSSDPPGPRQQIILLRNILFVYLSFEVIASIHTGLLQGTWKFDLFRPSFAMWFLLSLFTWRATLQYAARIRHILPISLAISFGTGFVASAGHTLSISRSLAFWPIFLLGWKLRDGKLLQLTQNPIVKWVSTVCTAVGMFFLWLLHQKEILKTRQFQMSSGYETDTYKLAEGGGRVAILLFGTCAAIALLSWLTTRFVPVITYLGSGSFYIYVLHPLILKQAKAWDLLPHTSGKAEILLLAAGLTALAFTLGSRPVRKATRWIVQPTYTRPFTLNRSLNA